MEKILLSPPVAFIIIFAACILLSRLFSAISFRPVKYYKNHGTPYGCGEKNYDHMAQPDYSTFFPFVFFFTIAHVATMIMTTVPKETPQTFILAVLYMTGVSIGLYILMRR